MRKLLTCALVLCLCLVCAGALAADTFEVDGIIYQEIDGRAVSVDYNQLAETITYHETVRNLPVRLSNTRGDYDWIDPPGAARTLIIAEGVTSVPEDSFLWWPALEKIVLPSTLRTIGNNSLANHQELREVILPEGLISIGNWALYGCAKLESITVPASVTSLGAGALGGSFAQITLAEGNTAYKMEGGVIYTKDGGTLVLVPGTFTGELVIPDTVSRIAEGAMVSTERMTALTVPEGFTKFDSMDIGQCFNLERLTLPASVTAIDNQLLDYYGLPNLDWIEVDPANQTYYSIDGMLFDRAEKKLIFAPRLRASIDVPMGTLAIAPGVFAQRDNLVSVTLPMGIREIPDYTFGEATALSRVTLPITLETIGSSAFSDCIALESITLPPGLSKIDTYAFINCSALKSLTLPACVTEIDFTALPKGNPAFVLYCQEGSAGQKAAWIADVPWAVPGGTPVNQYQAERRTLPAAVVSNASKEEKLNLRQSPSKDSTSLGKYDNGTTVLVLGAENGWAHVRLGDIEGYMLEEALTYTDSLTGSARVMWCRAASVDAPLAVYAMPSPNASATQVQTTEILLVTDQLGTWLEVELDGGHGYVKAGDVCMAWKGEVVGEYWRTVCVVMNPDPRDRLNLRAEPNKNSQSLGRYFNGTIADIIEWHDDWYKVSIDGKEGYMLREFLRDIGDGKYTLDMTQGHG